MQLSRCDPSSTIHLISGTPLIKAVTNFTQVMICTVQIMYSSINIGCACCKYMYM